MKLNPSFILSLDVIFALKSDPHNTKGIVKLAKHKILETRSRFKLTMSYYQITLIFISSQDVRNAFNEWG